MRRPRGCSGARMSPAASAGGDRLAGRRRRLAARARVDDRRQLGFELGAKRLHSRRETESVAEVFELLVELKSRPASCRSPSALRATSSSSCRRSSGRRSSSTGAGPRWPRRGRAGSPRRRRRRRRCGARRRRGRRRTGGRAARRSTSGRSARRRARAGRRPGGSRGAAANGSLLLERRERARALEAEDAVLGGDVVGVGDQRRVGRVGHHQLDLVALGVPEDERLRLGRVQPQHLGVRAGWRSGGPSSTRASRRTRRAGPGGGCRRRPGTPAGASLNSRKVTTLPGLPSSSPK